MAKKATGQTFIFENPPHIVAHASIVGPDESKGPYSEYFDLHLSDSKHGKDSWEKGEEKMAADAVNLSLDKASVTPGDVDFLLGGDLLNQLITADFVARDIDASFLGLYSACATLTEGLILAASLMDGGFADCTVAFSSSHYQTAERQYRTPLEYGAQYPPYKQFTVTAAGSYVLGWLGGNVWITHGTLGKVIDLGVSDPNDLGSAMAPAAADTILQNFSDLNRGINDYDLILTGDLGITGKKMLAALLEEKNIIIDNKLIDCGAEIFGGKKQYGSGGSGVGASAAFMGSVIIPKIIAGEINRVLLIGTGALLSPLTVKQNESIPAIAHGAVVEKIPGSWLGNMGSYVMAFLVGGLICAIGQVFLDNTNYTPAHLLVGLVVLGSIFTGLGWYEPLIKIAGAGVTIPVSNFGYILTKGVLEAAEKDGFFGLFKGVLEMASAGVSASVIIAFFIALIFNPKG